MGDISKSLPDLFLVNQLFPPKTNLILTKTNFDYGLVYLVARHRAKTCLSLN